MGGNDDLTRPIDKRELAARVRTHIKRKRHGEDRRERLAAVGAAGRRRQCQGDQ